MKMKHLFGLVGSAGVFALSAAAFSELSLKTTEYNLKTGKSGCPVTVTVLSDLHFSVFGKDNCRLIKAVKATAPDLILIAGDFFDFHGGRSNKDAVMKTLRSLCTIAPVYMAPGNHDLRFNVQTGENYRLCAESAGVTVLDGEYADMEINGQEIRLGGVFDYSVNPEDFSERRYSLPAYKFLKDFENTDKTKLLIMHRPNTFIFTDDEWDIDAVVCGHDHGGIWQIPFIGGVYAPEQGFFPKYDKGEYSFGKMKMFLSSGLEGYYIVPRIFNRVEIMKISIN